MLSRRFISLGDLPQPNLTPPAVDPPTNVAVALDMVATPYTNLILSSQTIGDANWYTGGGATPTLNYGVAPDGTSTSTQLVEDNTTNYHYVQQAIAGIGNNTFTYSVYAKAGTRGFLSLYFNSFWPNGGAYFDLVNGVVGNTAWDLDSATITDAGNGWWRCTITQTTPGTGTMYVFMAMSDSDRSATAVINQYAGDGTSDIEVWGVQIETGAVANAYIATTSVAVTQNSSMTVSWDAVTDATSYSVWRSTETGAEMLVKSGVATTSWQNSYLNDGRIYYYKVKATDGSLTSVFSAEVSKGTAWILDSFDRADSYSSGSADIGGAWAICGFAAAYELGILSNRANYGSASAQWSGSQIDSGQTDGVMRAKFYGSGSQFLMMYLYRYVDANNFAYVSVQGYNGNSVDYTIGKHIAGADTSTNVNEAVSWVTGDELKVTFNGDATEIFLNGVSKNTADLAGGLTSGTIQALFIYGNATYPASADNLTFTPD